MDDAEHPEPEGQVEDYLRLLAAHERSLAAYVHCLVPETEDAEDILQECRVTLWKHFSRFEPGTNFLAWARRIALHQILNHRRRQKRRPFTAVDERFIESVAEELDRRGDDLERRAEALRHCLRLLPKPHLQAIAWRYGDDVPVEEIAAKTDRSEGAVYRLLSRIRQNLNECVTRRVRAVA